LLLNFFIFLKTNKNNFLLVFRNFFFKSFSLFFLTLFKKSESLCFHIEHEEKLSSPLGHRTTPHHTTSWTRTWTRTADGHHPHPRCGHLLRRGEVDICTRQDTVKRTSWRTQTGGKKQKICFTKNYL
jgi:hypothetical protein